MFEHRERPRSTFNRLEATRLFLGAAICAAALVSGCEPAVRLRPSAWAIEEPPEHNRTWLLDRDAVFVARAGSDARSEQIDLPGWIRVAEPDVCPPALAQGPGGEAAVTSNIMPTIWRIDPISFAVTRHDLALDGLEGREEGFSGLTYSMAQATYFGVSGLDGALWRIDAALSRATLVNLTARMPRACGVRVVPGVERNPGLETLCVRTEGGEWQVNLAAPERNHGTAHPATCWPTPKRGSPLQRVKLEQP